MSPLPVRKQTGPVLKNLSVFLYGMPKIGKTTEAAKFPNPVLLNCEPSGTDLLRGQFDVIDITTLGQLETILPDLAGSDYRTIIVDGFTWLVNAAVREQVRKYPNRDRRRHYVEVTDQVSRILGELLTSGKLVIATGHSKVGDADDDSVDGTTGNQTAGADEKIEIRPDINPRLGDGVYGLFSIIAYCYASPDGAKMLTKPIDTPKRRIFAGDRSGVLPKMMPLSAEKLQEHLRAAATPAPKATKTEEPA